MVISYTELDTLHPALRYALSSFGQDHQRQAATDLGVILRERLAVDGEQAWTASHLTGDGFPVEMAFTTADTRLRFTAEMGPIGLTPQARLHLTIQTVERLSGAGVPSGAVALLERAQQGEVLGYGAWLGCRYGADAAEYKIYGEVADDIGAGLESGSLHLPMLRLDDRKAQRQMLAYSLGSGQWEVYMRVPSLMPYHVQPILAPIGQAEMARPFLDFLREAYGHRWRDRLPGQTVGVSYACRPPEPPQSATFFFFARVFWGGDAYIRQRFTTLADTFGWDAGHYLRVTETIAARNVWQTCHGILGFTVTRAGQIALSIGVRPLHIEAA